MIITLEELVMVAAIAGCILCVMGVVLFGFVLWGIFMALKEGCWDIECSDSENNKLPREK
jgi:hypothetical protein